MIRFLYIFSMFLMFMIGSICTNAQKLQLSIFGGFSNYQGDLQDKRFTLDQSHSAFGGGVLYDINNHFTARANFTRGKISAADKYTRNKSRNLEFTSVITDYHVGLEYHLLDIYEKNFTAYVFSGISLFTFDPYITTVSGKMIKLRPLSTEGQGFYNNRKVYKPTQISLPFGGGFKYLLSNTVTIGVEVGLRKTGTDYIDDVSTTYIDKDLLNANRGALAVAYAFRTSELNHTAYPLDGTQRGSAKNKDWYYFGGLNFIVRIPSRNN